MKALLKNNREIVIDYFSVVDGLMTLKTRWESYENMNNIFSDPVATAKITIDEGDKQTTYENYTGFEEIRRDKNGTITVIMSTTGAGTIERISTIENNMRQTESNMEQAKKDIQQAQKDIEGLQETGTTAQAYSSVLALAKMEAQTITDDKKAFAVKELFDEWNGGGIEYKTGKYLRYKEILYKVIKDHTSQADWTPDTANSLFTPVGEMDAGTKDNPIVWVSGMESEKDKYYTDEGVLYIGLEDSMIGLQGKPKDLQRYFKVVDVA